MRSEQYEVIRDSREQAGQGWNFAPSKHCTGTTIGKLATGDYTIVGHEATFVIGRKGSIAEFAGNIYQAQFEAELARMKSFHHAFLVLEFTMEDIFRFPESSDIPQSELEPPRITPAAFLLRICELQQKYPRVQFIFAGSRGKAFAASQFKRLLEAENQATRKAG